MKQKILIGLIFISGLTFGQKKAVYEKSITVISPGFGKCGYKAFKIIGNTVQIDTCFDNEKKVFKIDRITELKSNPLFTRLIETKITKWKQMENEINKVNNCDYLGPFEVIISENDIVDKFYLNRMQHCYPSSAKQILEGLDNYFNQMYTRRLEK